MKIFHIPLFVWILFKMLRFLNNIDEIIPEKFLLTTIVTILIFDVISFQLSAKFTFVKHTN